MDMKAIVLATTLIITPAIAAPFTYQGSLQDGGTPANGAYDIRISLHNALVGGSQIGPTLNFNGVSVNDGLFELEVDFGDVFDANNSYIFIQVRDGASTGAYTGLSPRSPITSTPKAQFAATAGALANPQWIEAPGILHYGDGDDKVFINRTNPFDPSEIFGVHSINPGYAGMFISGPAGTLPYYAYSVDGLVSAYTYYNPTADSWTLWHAGSDAMWMDSTQNLNVNNNIVAKDFNFNTPRTNYISVMGDSFHSASADLFFGSTGNGGTYITNAGAGWLAAPIQLPHGATVTSVRAYFTDTNPTGDLYITLMRRTHGADGFGTLAALDTTTFNGSNLEAIDNSINLSTIDNNLYSYQVRAWSAAWDGTNSMQIESMVVEYTTTHAD
jgi:hypothetical protein